MKTFPERISLNKMYTQYAIAISFMFGIESVLSLLFWGIQDYYSDVLLLCGLIGGSITIISIVFTIHYKIREDYLNREFERHNQLWTYNPMNKRRR